MKDSLAIAIWSVLPLIATCMVVQRNGWLALIFGSITAIAFAAAFLSRSTSTHQAIAAALLLFISAPVAVGIIARLAKGPCPLAAAAGFVADTVIEALFSVPPIVLAVGVWRRRKGVIKHAPHA